LRKCEADAVQALRGAESEHQFLHGRIGGDPLPVLERIDETRSRHHLEAFINSNDKLRRYRRSFDGAKLHTFDLSGDRA